MIKPRSVQEYYAFFGGEESGIPLDKVAEIWTNAVSSVKPPKACKWTYSDIDDYWSTECGEAFCTEGEGLKSQRITYCPFCGGKINEHTIT